MNIQVENKRFLKDTKAKLRGEKRLSRMILRSIKHLNWKDHKKLHKRWIVKVDNVDIRLSIIKNHIEKLNELIIK